MPDIMVYEATRIQAYKAADPDWRKKPFVIVPDLGIEVISPGDSYIDVDEKVERYLSEGVKLVWVMNPRNRSVTVYAADGDSFLRLTGDKILSGGDVIANFSLRVSDIFTNL